MPTKTFDCTTPGDGGRVTRGGLWGASAVEVLGRAHALTPVRYPNRLVVSYVLNGMRCQLQNDVGFNELPDGAMLTIEVEEDPEHSHLVEDTLQFFENAKSVANTGKIPNCYVFGPIGSGKSSFLNTLLGALLQRQQACTPIFAEPGCGTDHKTISLDTIEYYHRVFGVANEDVPEVKKEPMRVFDTKGLNLDVTANEKNLIELVLRGGLAPGQSMSWDNLSLFRRWHWFNRSGRMPDVIIVVWPATEDPHKTGGLLKTLKAANDSLDVPVPIYLVVTKQDVVAGQRQYAGKTAAAEAEVARRAARAARLLGASSEHTFTVTNVCKDSSQQEHNAFVDRQFIDIFSKVMHSGYNVRRKR